MQRETIEQVLTRSPLIAEAVTVDPRVNTVLSKAAHESSYAERWQSYEALKREAETVVGYIASQPLLRTEYHYRAMLDAIDALLPQHENDFVILVPRTDAPQEKGQTA